MKLEGHGGDVSRSVHQTLKSVFGSKSKHEIERMIKENDPDLVAYLEKRRIKRRVRNSRQLMELARELGEELPEQFRDRDR